MYIYVVMYFTLYLFVMSYPNWVLKHKKKNTEIRFISNRYYLYKITSKWDPIKKRTKKVTLGLIGAITEDGIRYTADRKKAREEKNTAPALEFGASYILNDIGSDIRSSLVEYFGEQDANSLFVLAIIKLIESSPLKIIKDLYSNSYLSVLYKGLQIGPNQLSSLFKFIGSKRDKIVEFFNSFIYANECILFDATNIASKSSNLGINEKGFCSTLSFNKQVNLLYMFSKSQKQPIYYRIVPGNIKEVSAFKNCVKEFKAENAVIIADKGFVSRSNIENLNNEKLKYILPLKRNHSLIDYSFFKNKGYDNFDGYFMFKKRVIWYKNQKTNDDTRLISYYDGKLAEKERQDYIQRVEKEVEGYTIDSYNDRENKFGFISMQTSLKEEIDENEVFNFYKGRADIEQLFDILKNTLEADKTYMRGEKELEAWFLVNHISMMLYYRLFEKLKISEMLKKYSPMDIIKYGKQIRKIKIKNNWYTSEITSKIKTFFKKCNLTVP